MQSLLKAFGWNKDEHRVLMMGLDATGKTTLLYMLKLGELITAIPTIGFNVESVPNANAIYTFWDVGGCDKIRPLWRHYFQNTQVLLFVIDSSDHDRVGEWTDEIRRITAEDELRNVPILFVANKQDLVSSMPIEEIRSILQNQASMTSHKWEVIPVTATNAQSAQGVLAALSRLLYHKPKSNIPVQSTTIDLGMPSVDDLKQRIESTVDEPQSHSTFLQDFSRGTVVRFDHRAHLRVGFLVLVQSLNQETSVSDAINQFLNVLRQFFEKADKTLIRNTFHITMSIFWCQAILHGIATLSNKLSRSLTDMDFPNFLTENPHLMWSGLWTSHYRKDTIFSKAAAESFVLPDLKPYPSFVAIATMSAFPSQQGKQEAQNLTDENLMKEFESGTMHWLDKDLQDRIIFISLLRRHFLKGERRGLVVSDIMGKIERLSLRVRAQNTEAAPIYSTTVCYFWIQIISTALASLPKNDLDHLSYKRFRAMFPTLLDPLLWREYYTDKTFGSVSARATFTIPDKKPLPNIIPAASTPPDTPQVITLQIPDDDEFMRQLASSNFPDFSHLDFIRLIWIELNRSSQKKERRPVAIDRVLETLTESSNTKSFSQNKGLTYILFWIQMVTRSIHGADDCSSCQFLTRHNELLTDKFIFRYYSHSTLFSPQATVLFSPPDVQSLPAFVI